MNENDYFVLYTPDKMNRTIALMEKDFSQDELFSIFKSDDDIAKQVCLIKLKKIYSHDEAQALASILTGQHGPIREICSAKINYFLKNEYFRQFFSGEKIRTICLNALDDIIPTVTRNILEVIKFLPDNNTVYNCLIDRICKLHAGFEYIKDLSNHESIKKTFQLYWYLEALSELVNNDSGNDKLESVIQIGYQHDNYTIREKTAKILSKVNGFEYYKNVLKSDKNPYVFSYLQ